MKLLIITDFGDQIGIGMQILRVYKGLQKLGADVDLLNLVSPRRYNKEPNDGYIIKTSSFMYGVIYLFPKKVYQFIKQHEYDLIHLGHPGLAYLYKNIPTAKSICVLDFFTFYPDLYGRFNIKFLLYNQLILFHMNKFKHFTAISNFTKNDFYKYVDRNKQIYIIHPACVDPEQDLNQHEMLNQFKIVKGIDLKKKIILHVGTDEKRKNVDTFYKIASQLPNYLFIRIGKSNTQLSNLITYSGISDDDLNKFYQLSDLFLFTSIYEGFGMPIIEAYKNQCKIISSQVSDMPDIFKNDRNVHFVDDPKNDQQYISLIKSHINDSFIKQTDLPTLQEEASAYISFFSNVITC